MKDLWIDCKDRLPKAGQVCLVYRPDAPKTQDPMYRTAVFTGEHFACYVQPSHWLPLEGPLTTAPVECCKPTAHELKLLSTGDYTPEELWGGSRPTCPNCLKADK